jgi:cobalt transporter subunit CbtB
MSVKTTVAASSATSSKLLQALFAASLGIFIVGFVGFSHAEPVHNAAHDTRHANAFPCH